ncbi:Terminase-like family protein [compost metagenome]
MPAAKAQQAWRKIIARMRYNVPGLRNGIDVTTTPEGFKFVYQQFVKAVRDKPELAALYGLIQASTFDNAKNLPDDYIPSLLSSYPDELIQAYLRGKFTNLNSGTIYHTFNRKLNNCTDEIQDNDPLFIGMDFNVGKMAAIVHVKRNSLPRAVRELVKVYDTPAMIKRIQEEFWRYEDGRYVKSREIYIYPDASGDSRKSQNASKTDIAQLNDAGFSVIVDDANPPVKDRINSMNAMFCNANGERRYRVFRCGAQMDWLSAAGQIYFKKSAQLEPDVSGAWVKNPHRSVCGYLMLEGREGNELQSYFASRPLLN